MRPEDSLYLYLLWSDLPVLGKSRTSAMRTEEIARILERSIINPCQIERVLQKFLSLDDPMSELNSELLKHKKYREYFVGLTQPQ
jgi:hypothetical protein